MRGGVRDHRGNCGQIIPFKCSNSASQSEVMTAHPGCFSWKSVVTTTSKSNGHSKEERQMDTKLLLQLAMQERTSCIIMLCFALLAGLASAW